MRHGTVYCYDQGCRCFWCREVKNEVRRGYREGARRQNSPAYQRELATARATKERYRGTCRTCGKPTTGCNGPGTAPELCQACYRDAHRAPHGTRSAYGRGCRCDECRAANRDAQRAYRARKSREGGGGSPSPRPPT